MGAVAGQLRPVGQFRVGDVAAIFREETLEGGLDLFDRAIGVLPAKLIELLSLLLREVVAACASVSMRRLNSRSLN
ncbi:hypothetical protein ACL9RL_11385 [Plantibacter sp. Mn2098]|uniref:hypothetical protein n=1 Tax=Plantibacter sp. Mn2098 TaxID=3395266 RepID=UPI003BCDB4CF